MGIAFAMPTFYSKGDDMKTRICSAICVICLLLGLSLLLSSCELGYATGISGAEINEKGELILKYSNGTDQNLGVVVGNNGENGSAGSPTITADGKTEVSLRVMRVDTAVNSGNSGGGLYNDEGNLIGIVNAKIVYDGVENIGYAISSSVAAAIAEI